MAQIFGKDFSAFAGTRKLQDIFQFYIANFDTVHPEIIVLDLISHCSLSFMMSIAVNTKYAFICEAYDR